MVGLLQSAWWQHMAALVELVKQLCIKFHAIATHERPHVSDRAAIWMLRHWGEETFSGSASATIVYSGIGGEQMTKLSYDPWERWFSRGFIPIGILGSMFDEHRRPKHERIEGECEATLMASMIGLRDKPWFKEFCDELLSADTQGPRSNFALGHIVNTLHRQDTPENVGHIAEKIFDVLYADRDGTEPVSDSAFDRAVASWLLDQEGEALSAKRRWVDVRISAIRAETQMLCLSGIIRAFVRQNEPLDIIFDILDVLYNEWMALKEATDEFRSSAKVTVCRGYYGEIKVGHIISNSPYMARAGHRLGVDVVVQFRQTGHFHVFPRKFLRLQAGRDVAARRYMRDVVRLLRLEARKCNGYPMYESSDYQLRAKERDVLESIEGRVSGAPDIYYFAKTGWIMNGSLTHPNVDPTKIPHERIVHLVELAFSGNFHPYFEQNFCSRGKCAGEVCPWFNAALLRCREIRYSSERRGTEHQRR